MNCVVPLSIWIVVALVSGAGDGYVQCYFELAVNVEASPGEDPRGNCILGSP